MGTDEGKRPSEGAPEGAPASKRARQEGASAGGAAAGDGGDAGAPSSSSAAAAAPAAKPAGLSLGALEKAKRALQLQAALKAKLAKLPPSSKAPDPSSAAATGATTSTSAAAAPPAAAAASMKPRAGPIPLRLDDQGRELDEQGRVIDENKRAAETRKDERLPPPPPLPLPPPPPFERPPPALNPYFDPSLGRASRGSHHGRRGALSFVPAGRYASEAAAARSNQASNNNNNNNNDDDKNNDESGRAPSSSAARAAAAAAAAAAPPRPPTFRDPRAPVPPVEWWDARLLSDKTSYKGGSSGIGTGGKSEEGAEGEGKEANIFFFDARNLRPGRVSSLVEHPVPLPPPAEPAPPPAAPLLLTAKERKKLRTQRRNERESEKRLLIQQGLLEPPKTKVRLSNMARVLGSSGVADATAVEATVRAAAAERQAAHEDHNAATRLTPAERRAKKDRKLAAAAGAGPDGAGDPAVAAALYCISGPALEQSNKLKFKVRANADELQLSGCAAVSCRSGEGGSGSGGAGGGFAVVLVEGGPRALKKFDRLMRARIDWSRPDGVPGAHVPESDSEESEEEGGEGGAMDEDGKAKETKQKKRRFVPSVCSLAWRGAVPRRAFEGRFSLGLHANAAACRAALSAAGVPHYFDLVASIVSEGGGGVEGEGDDDED